MKASLFIRIMSLSLLVALLVGVMGIASAQEPKVLITGIGMVGADPDNGLDPSLSTNVQSIAILDHLYVGVTRLNEVTAQSDPGMATDWEVSEDGTVYTFNLMPEVPWVRYNAETGAVEQVTDADGNVRYVTAQDFVFGITRTLNPETAGDYAYVLAPYIVGGAEYNGGEGALEDLQVAALDEYTLQITAPEATAFAINIYGLWMARAQPAWAIEEFGDSWTEAENVQTYGPFTVKEWNHDQDLTMIKNPFWAGTEAVPQPRLDEVVFRFIDNSQQFAEYLAGTMDAVEIPAGEVPRVLADPVLNAEYYAGTEGCSIYYGFNMAKEPFTNRNIRLAFSLAVDRVSLMENVTRDGRIPARWYTYPTLAAAPTLEEYPDLGVTFDPEGAVAALEAGLAELGLESAADLPAIELAYGDTEYNARIAQAVQQMITDTLGIQVQISGLETTTYYDRIEEDAPQMFRAGWCFDYPDTNNFLYETMRSDSPYNYPGFNNAEFDGLVDEARLLTDNEARESLYVRAEEILVEEDVAIMPLYYHVTRQLVKSNVERTYSVIGLERYEKWDIVAN